MVTMELFGEPWVLFRDAQGLAACVKDACAHRACPLSLVRPLLSHKFCLFAMARSQATEEKNVPMTSPAWTSQKACETSYGEGNKRVGVDLSVAWLDHVIRYRWQALVGGQR